MVWLAALLEILAFLEFLTSALGLSLVLWSGLYYGLSLGLQLDLMQAATLAGVVALILYFSLE
ncbi:MAG: hypothetical protein ICV77_16245 [Cyanobacteria bacterium Co-bin8]|nr:hypothetical protein [Cyanobacteria bacterium Co-bin8]